MVFDIRHNHFVCRSCVAPANGDIVRIGGVVCCGRNIVDVGAEERVGRVGSCGEGAEAAGKGGASVAKVADGGDRVIVFPVGNQVAGDIVWLMCGEDGVAVLENPFRLVAARRPGERSRVDAGQSREGRGTAAEERLFEKNVVNKAHGGAVVGTVHDATKSHILSGAFIGMKRNRILGERAFVGDENCVDGRERGGGGRIGHNTHNKNGSLVHSDVIDAHSLKMELRVGHIDAFVQLREDNDGVVEQTRSEVPVETVVARGERVVDLRREAVVVEHTIPTRDERVVAAGADGIIAEVAREGERFDGIAESSHRYRGGKTSVAIGAEIVNAESVFRVRREIIGIERWRESCDDGVVIFYHPDVSVVGSVPSQIDISEIRIGGKSGGDRARESGDVDIVDSGGRVVG